MPLFRRGPKGPTITEFTVGSDGHRVQINAPQPGCPTLQELDDWVSSVRRIAGTLPNGGEPIAVKNAKWDYAEMVTELTTVFVLTFEELAERGLVDAAEVPERPQLPRLARSSTYEYIDNAYIRAEQQRSWLNACDALLRERGVALLVPLPHEREDTNIRAMERRPR